MAFRLAGAMQRAGHSYEDFAAAVRTSDDTGLAGWYAETGRKPGLHNGEWVDERELHRAWDNAAGDVFEPAQGRVVSARSDRRVVASRLLSPSLEG